MLLILLSSRRAASYIVVGRLKLCWNELIYNVITISKLDGVSKKPVLSKIDFVLEALFL